MTAMLASVLARRRVSSSTKFATYMASLGPVAWWRMDDPIGSASLNDTIANEKLALTGSQGSTYTLGSSSLLTGDSDTAVAFNGGAANTAASSKWALGTGDFSACIVGKWTGTSLACLACIRDSGSTNILFLFMVNRVSAGDVDCEGWNWNTQKITIAGSYNDGKPHVLGLTYKASTNELRFYLDGVLKQTQVQSGPYTRPTAATMGVRLANNFNSQYFIGTADECAVFNRLLSDTEMATLASNALNG